jgi:hypothetical protein
LQGLSPEEREQMLQRMRARGFDPSAFGGEGSSRSAGPSASNTEQRARGNATPRSRSEAPSPADQKTGATTIDALFGPLPVVETRGRVWLYVDKTLKPVQLRLGITDGQATELIEGDLEPGTEVVTNVTTGSTATRPAAQGGFPFLGQPGRGGFGAGGGGGARGTGGGGGGAGRGGR